MEMLKTLLFVAMSLTNYDPMVHQVADRTRITHRAECPSTVPAIAERCLVKTKQAYVKLPRVAPVPTPRPNEMTAGI
jgi:hypothetical protein